jgi:hypothetical protein
VLISRKCFISMLCYFTRRPVLQGARLGIYGQKEIRRC